MSKITVLFFASVADIVGTKQQSREISEEASGADLKKLLAQDYPDLEAVLKSCRIARNQEFVPDDTVLSSGDEVAIIPPVSGG